MTKTRIFLVTAIVICLVIIMYSCSRQETDPASSAAPGVALSTGKAAPDVNGPHFNLNIIGVPHDKVSGSFDNSNRHTIFIPLYTDWYVDPCQSGGSTSNKGDAVGAVAELPDKGIRLRIGPSDDGTLDVLDGNATDDQYAELLMPATPNGYNVYISGKGKPGGCLDIDAYAIDYGIDTTMFFIGHVDVDRKTGRPTWQNAKWLLYSAGGAPFFADPYDLYFWQLYNNGLRLMQIRFYPAPSAL